MTEKIQFRAFNAKEDRIINKVGKSGSLVAHKATSSDKTVGLAETVLFNETKDGVTQLLAAYGIRAKSLEFQADLYKDFVNVVNRQEKTDDKNTLRAPKSEKQVLGEMLKGKHGLTAQTEAKALLAKYSK